jgi:GNAT superfamily N-acetyltransferase
MGDPADWYWRDLESFADTFTGYWTDREPEHAQVVEVDGEVSGYMLGCVDTGKADDTGLVVARNLIGGRHLLFRPGTAGFMWRSIGNVIVDGARRELPPRTSHDERWPAHLHIDLLPVARGQGAGATMINRWLDTLRGLGVAGCHLDTVAENRKAIAFFEAVGFRKHGRNFPLPGLRSPTRQRHHSQLMVQSLEPAEKPAAPS